MSSALAIAGVTAVLRDLLNDGMVSRNVSGVLGSTVTVSVVPPDRVIPQNGTEASQLNLFLHQVTPNAGWRNEGLPARDASGRHRLSNPPLAIDLHYLLSAYSSGDLHGEILLGHAMQLLHENPVLTREAIRTALNPSPDVGEILPPALQALADCGLADQIEQLKITAEHLNTEEMSKLWTATQSHYRPTAAYQVCVVLIQSTQPARSPLPVLSRGPVDPDTQRDRGVVVEPSLIPSVPMLDAVIPAGGQPVARMDETIDLSGHHLDGSNREVRLVNERFEVEETLAAVAGNQGGLIQFSVPSARSLDFPVGLYQVSARLVRPEEDDARETNRLALILAPAITTDLPLDVVRDDTARATFSLSFRPQIRSGQQATLFLGQQEVIPQPFTAPTDALDFVVEEAPLGSHLARLQIDGIVSPIINRGATPPVFFDLRINIA